MYTNTPISHLEVSYLLHNPVRSYILFLCEHGKAPEKTKLYQTVLMWWSWGFIGLKSQDILINRHLLTQDLYMSQNSGKAVSILICRIPTEIRHSLLQILCFLGVGKGQSQKQREGPSAPLWPWSAYSTCFANNRTGFYSLIFFGLSLRPWLQGL